MTNLNAHCLRTALLASLAIGLLGNGIDTYGATTPPKHSCPAPTKGTPPPPTGTPPPVCPPPVTTTPPVTGTGSNHGSNADPFFSHRS